MPRRRLVIFINAFQNFVGYELSDQLPFKFYQPGHVLLADDFQEPGVFAAGVRPGGGAEVVAVGVGGQDVFAGSLAGAEVISREDSAVFVGLLLTVADKTAFLHYGRKKCSVGRQVKGTITVDEVTSFIGAQHFPNPLPTSFGCHNAIE